MNILKNKPSASVYALRLPYRHLVPLLRQQRLQKSKTGQKETYINRWTKRKRFR